MPDRDEHYVKYRVFYEPKDEHFDSERIGHPVPMKADFLESGDENVEIWIEAVEVEGLFYVLRPEHDHHARVAIAAYAYSCMNEYPQLAADLIMMVESIRWEEETGQHRDDLPLTREDFLPNNPNYLGLKVVKNDDTL